MTTTTCCILHNLCEEQNEPISEKSLKKVETFNEKYPQPQDKSNWEFDSYEGEDKRNEIIDWMTANNIH